MYNVTYNKKIWMGLLWELNGLLKVGVMYQNGARMNAKTVLAKTMPK